MHQYLCDRLGGLTNCFLGGYRRQGRGPILSPSLGREQSLFHVAFPSSSVNTWKAMAIFYLSLCPEGLMCDPQLGLKEFCEGQDEQVTKCEILSAVRGLLFGRTELT